MEFDFSAYKKAEVVNKRTPGGLPPKVQEFSDLKYRKGEKDKDGKKSIVANFYVSTERFKGLGLATLALTHFSIPGKPLLLAVVADADGKYLRARKGKEKGHSFKSDAMEAALAEAGVIDTTKLKSNQFIALTEVGANIEIDGVKVIKAFTLSVGTAKPKAEKKAKVEGEVASTTSEGPGVVADAAPAATEAAKPANTSDEGDWQ